MKLLIGHNVIFHISRCVNIFRSLQLKVPNVIVESTSLLRLIMFVMGQIVILHVHSGNVQWQVYLITNDGLFVMSEYLWQSKAADPKVVHEQV